MEEISVSLTLKTDSADKPTKRIDKPMDSSATSEINPTIKISADATTHKEAKSGMDSPIVRLFYLSSIPTPPLSPLLESESCNLEFYLGG